MKYEIKGGSFPVVICNLENGEKMITERGSMCWMSPNMQMETKGGGLGKMFSKAFSGESMRVCEEDSVPGIRFHPDIHSEGSLPTGR